MKLAESQRNKKANKRKNLHVDRQEHFLTKEGKTITDIFRFSAGGRIERRDGQNDWGIKQLEK